MIILLLRWLLGTNNKAQKGDLVQGSDGFVGRVDTIAYDGSVFIRTDAGLARLKGYNPKDITLLKKKAVK